MDEESNVPNFSKPRQHSSASSSDDLEKGSTPPELAPDLDGQHKVEGEQYPVMDLDHGIVAWDSQDDPANPRKFSSGRKKLLLGLVSSITFVSPLASSMFAPGITFVDTEFHNTSTILASLAVSIFVLGFALGPLVLSPLSEIYGRYPVLTTANVFFSLFQIGCALAPNLGALIVFRLLAGIGGSACLTIGAGVIGDMYETRYRGAATGIFSVGPLFGPVIGPICGGFLSQRAGWRWVFWVLLIASGIVVSVAAIINKETNAVVLLGRKTKRLRKELNRPELRSYYDKEEALSSTTILLRGLWRPFKLLCHSVIVVILSTYMAFVYGLLYLLFTTITLVFQQQYGWAPELTGLAYLGVGIGFLLGVVSVAKTSDATVVRLTKANNGVYEPEMRLPMMVFYAMLIPISFFWYGWAVEAHTHWIVPIIGLMPFGIGMMGVFLPIQTYCIDAYTRYAASALACLSFTRSIAGAFLPMAGPTLYSSLGYGVGNSVLGAIAFALIPAPALIYKFGGTIRKKYPVEL